MHLYIKYAKMPCHVCIAMYLFLDNNVVFMLNFAKVLAKIPLVNSYLNSHSLAEFNLYVISMVDSMTRYGIDTMEYTLFFIRT